jgi:hypothetical protein
MLFAARPDMQQGKLFKADAPRSATGFTRSNPQIGLSPHLIS